MADEWEQLWSSVPDASPFQHPAWLVPWSRVYAPGRCRAAALRCKGQLKALLAAFVWEGALLAAGTGPSDHCSALFAPGSGDCADDMLDQLACAFDEPFDRIDLQQLPTNSPAGTDCEGEGCVVLRLEGKDGMANIPKKMRSNWRYSVRRLKREGAAIETVSAGEATEAAAELERLHAIRWQAEGEEGVLADDLAARHLRLAIPELARAGLLRMYRLRSEGTTIAILFTMSGARSICFYLSGFDPEWEKYSPGTALIGTAIAEAAAEGCTEFDFLRGQEQYKYRWGAEDRPMGRRLVTVPVRANEAACA